MSIDTRPDLKVLVGLGALLHDVEEAAIGAAVHELEIPIVRELVGC